MGPKSGGGCEDEGLGSDHGSWSLRVGSAGGRVWWEETMRRVYKE